MTAKRWEVEKPAGKGSKELMNFQLKVAREEFKKAPEEVREQIFKEREREYEEKKKEGQDLVASPAWTREQVLRYVGALSTHPLALYSFPFSARDKFTAAAEPLNTRMGELMDCNVIMTAYKVEKNVETGELEVFFVS